METIKLKLNYNQVSQLGTYFKSLENAPLTFPQRRKLIKFNEVIGKEYKLLFDEIKRLAEQFCEKDADGNFIETPEGGQKIKEGEIENCNNALQEIYETETEIEFQPLKLPEEFFENFRCDKDTFKIVEDYFLE